MTEDADNLKGRTFDPPDLSDLAPEVRDVAVFAVRMRDKNVASIGEIERLGGGVELSSAKTEHVLTALVHMGVLTELQRWQIEADWERKLNRQLKEIRARLDEMISAQRTAAKHPPKKLILPPGMQN